MKSGELPYTRDGDNRRVTTKAAAALLNNCKDADADAILQDDDRPWTVVILPDKGNDPGVRYGQCEERQSVIIAPSEAQPESYYKDVPKPAPDPRIAMRNRAETAQVLKSRQGRSRLSISRRYIEALNEIFGRRTLIHPGMPTA